jgi:LuxR family maltose regulon positive regulatory protein
LREEEKFRVTRAVSSARVMLSYALLLRGRTDEAMEVFLPFLSATESQNLTGCLIIENPIVIPLLRHAYERKIQPAYAQSVLQRLSASLDPVGAAGGEALSDRELEVLRVMAEGLGNRDIASRLFVSEATVKTHVQRILRKLDSTSRTQAVARGRELMLI